MRFRISMNPYRIIDQNSYGGSIFNISSVSDFRRHPNSFVLTINELKLTDVLEFPTIDQPNNQQLISHYTQFMDLVKSYIGEYVADSTSNLYSIYRVHSIRLMKFSIHENKGEFFESLSLQSISILLQASKKKTIHNLIGYYDGVFRELIDKVIFSDAFLGNDVPVGIHTM